jgi:hypothetical protein
MSSPQQQRTVHDGGCISLLRRGRLIKMDNSGSAGDLMASEFQLQLSILPAPQRLLWDELGAVPHDFLLYGGTALALQLGHRASIDFDFFTSRLFDPVQLAATIPFLTAATITQQAPNTLVATVVVRGGPVGVSFFGLPDLRRLNPPLVAPDNSLQIASLLDLAGTKAAVVQQRAEAKDYLDVDAILQDGRIDLPMALSAARAIYGPKFNPQITLKALSFFGDGNLWRLPRTVQDRLAKAAREVDLDRLPKLSLGLERKVGERDSSQ